MLDIFVVSPYRDERAGVTGNRVHEAAKYVAELTRKGKVCYSTVSAMHHVSVRFDLPTSWEYWKKHCEAMMANAYEVHVLCLDGWEQSEGVQAEIEIAKMFNKKIQYVKKVGQK